MDEVERIKESAVSGIIQSTDRSFWGLSPVAPIHLGYDCFVAIQKELIKHVDSHIVLFADNHAMMTHGFSAEQVSRRSSYYEVYFRACCNLNADYILGSSFQNTHSYTEILYRALSKIRINKIKETLSKVSKNEGINRLNVSSLLYSIMQCLDCYHLKATSVVGGLDQKKIYKLKGEVDRVLQESSNFSPIEKFFYFPLGVDIQGKPLNSSNSKTRISIHETEQSLKQKVQKMYAPPHDQPLAEGRKNALLDYFKYSVFPWTEDDILLRAANGKKDAIKFTEFKRFEAAYLAGELTPQQCKEALFEQLLLRLRRTQDIMGSGVSDWIDDALL